MKHSNITSVAAQEVENERFQGLKSTAETHVPPDVYGFELLLDVHGCNAELFNRAYIDQYFSDLCDLIGMQKCEVYFWDDVGVPEEDRQTLPHTKGTSAVCFILTSSIVIHTLDLLRSVFVNIFSCRSFDPNLAADFTQERFAATVINKTFVERTLQKQG